MKKRFLLAVLIIFSITACGAPAVPTTALAPEPSVTLAPTRTVEPTATHTPLPTQTPEPTATLAPTATPVPEVINSENAARLQLVRRYGNGRMVQALLSPNGDQVLVLTSALLLAYDPASGEVAWQAETPATQMMAAYSQDGNTIVTLSADGAVTLWDPASGKMTRTALESKDGIDTCYLSSTGSVAVLGSSGKVTTAWDVEGGNKLGSNDGASIPQGIESVLVSPDGAMIWTNGFDSGGRQQIQAWDTKTGKFLYGLQGIGVNYIVGLSLSTDGSRIAGISRLALTSEVEFALWIWNAKTAELLKKVTLAEDIDAYTFIPGQDQVALASATGFLLADISSGDIAARFGGDDGTIISLNAAPDGKTMAAAGADGVVQIFDLDSQAATKEIKVDLSLTEPPYLVIGTNYIYRFERFAGLGNDPHGKFMAILSTDRMGIDLVDPGSLEVLKTIGKKYGPFATFAVSADGSMIVAVDEYNKVTLFNTASGALVKGFQADNQNFIRIVDLSPDGKLIATLSGGRLGELYLWDSASGEKLHTLSGFNVLKFSPDGKYVVSDNVDFGIYVWETATGKKLASPSADWIYDLDYAPDGATVAISGFEVHKNLKERENLITLFNTQTNTMLPLKLVGHPSIITEVRYSPDSKLIASADQHGNIRIWDAVNGTMLDEIRGGAPGPVQLTFLPEGRTLVLGSGDGTLRFYEIRN
jgi:WD40 repeat protein